MEMKFQFDVVINIFWMETIFFDALIQIVMEMANGHSKCLPANASIHHCSWCFTYVNALVSSGRTKPVRFKALVLLAIAWSGYNCLEVLYENFLCLVASNKKKINLEEVNDSKKMFKRSKTLKQARVCPNEKRNHRFMVSGMYTVQQSSGTPHF